MSDTEPRRVVVTGATTTPLRGRDPRDDDAEVVIVSVGPPDLAPEEAARLVTELAAYDLISVGVATGRVTAAAAVVLRACDLVVTGADAVWDAAAGRPATGADAVELGLALELAEDPERTAALLAAELSSFAGGALASTKQMIDSVAGADLTTALALESDLQIALLSSQAHQRIVAGMSRERPAQT
jgi:hypothetical protein